jgi:hypothetical protein
VIGGPSSAVISECGTYRYTLHRPIPCALRWNNPCLFWLINPSTADASIDDPTTRRCMGFAQLWNCTSLTIVNSFALIDTDPSELAKHKDPVGPANDWHVAEQVAAHRLGVIVVGWGANKMARARVPELAHLLEGVHCLGRTKAGDPRHPLYIRKTQQPEPWGTANAES